MTFFQGRATLFVVAAGSMFVAAPALAACGPGPVTLHLPEQRLDERLQTLAHSTGCMVDVDPALVAGRRAPALRGKVTTDSAFATSVKDAGLEAGPVQGHWRVSRDQQVYFADRIGTLRTRIDTGRQAQRITAQDAARLLGQLDGVGQGITMMVRQQGFLSAAERASYDRTLETVERQLQG